MTVRLQEAEWEYPCGAGTTMPFHGVTATSTDQTNQMESCTCGDGRNRRSTTRLVGGSPGNAWKLYDRDTATPGEGVEIGPASTAGRANDLAGPENRAPVFCGGLSGRRSEAKRYE